MYGMWGKMYLVCPSMSVCPSTHPPSHLSVHPSVHPSIYILPLSPSPLFFHHFIEQD